MAGGRPTKLTAELLEKIKDSLSHGLNLSETAARCGIGRDTLADYLKKPEVAKEVEGAIADLKLLVIKAIIAGGKDFCGKGWWLERRDPVWAKPELKWQMQLHDFGSTPEEKPALPAPSAEEIDRRMRAKFGLPVPEAIPEEAK